jgi:RHS repeat-associated protein
MKNLFITAIIASASIVSATAQTQQGTSFILNQHLTGNQHYKASQFVEMNVAAGSTIGFQYIANGSNEFIAEIDPFMVFPPEEGEFGGPAIGDNGIVGTIGGAFSVSQSGAANYSIPVKLPEGINGMKPALSIDYSSQGGNSFLGYGWNLSGLSSITRTGSNLFNDGLIRNIRYDYLDNFALDGNRLYVVAQLSDYRTEYRTEIETYSKIISYNDRLNDPVSFEVYTKSGQIIKYGFTEDSKIELNNSPTIRTWLVNKISDRYGNSIDFEYFEDNENGEFGIYRILYGGNLDMGIAHPIEVGITYEGRGTTYSIFNYISPGKKSVLSKKITEIGIKVNNQVQYKYIFGHMQGQPLRLNSIFLEYNNNSKYKTNPLSFEYKTPSLHDKRTITGIEYRYEYDGQFFAYDPAKTVMTDFTGDGLADILIVYTWESNPGKVVGYRLYKQNTNDSFSLIESGNLPNEEFVGFYPCDINGDMIADVIMVKKALSNDRRTDLNPWVSNGNGFTKHPNFYVDQKINKLKIFTADFNGDGKSEVGIVDRDHSNAHSMLYTFVFDFTNGYSVTKYDCLPFENLYGHICTFETRDMTADGLPELILIDNGGDFNAGAIKIFQYDFSNSWAKVEFIGRLDIPDPSNSIIYWGDFNADGYCDLMWQMEYNHTWKAALNDGEKLEYLDCPLKPLGSECLDHNNIKYSVKDYNGDGYADISERYLHYEFDPNSLKHDTSYYNTIYFSNGNRLAASISTVIKGYSSNHEFIDLCDMITDYNGDGINDMLFMYKNKTTAQMHLDSHCIYSNNTGSLISKFKDEYNNETKVSYAYLRNNDNIYKKYNDAVFPFADINVPSPIVSSIVAYEEANVNEPLLHRTKNYFYEGAKIHLHGKGFLGFMKVTESDPDSKITKETINEIFATNNYIATLPVKNSVKFNGTTPRLLSESESKWTIFNSFVGYPFRIAPYLTQVHTREWDLNGGFIKTQRAVSSYDQNGYIYGNPNNERAYSDEENLNAEAPTSSFKYEKAVTTVFKYDWLAEWVLTVPTLTIITHKQKDEATKDEKINNEYYPKGHSSFPLLKSTWANSGDTLSVKTEFVYNTLGLVTFKKISAPDYLKPLAARTETFHYKPEYGYRFLSGVTNTAGHYTENVFNTVAGKLTKKIDLNGLETKYYYDPTGNLIETRYYDSTRTASVNRWAKGHEDRPAKAIWYNWQCASGSLPSITFFDALGREIRTVTYNQDGNKIYIDKSYDRFGRLHQVSEPYFPGENSLLAISEFDDLNRPVKITTPGNLITNIVYNGRTITTSGPGPESNTVTTDAAGRKTKSADIQGNYVDYKYYSNGLLKSTTVNSNTATAITLNYDKNGNKITVNDPSHGTNQWRYDPYNQLIYTKDERSNRVKYNYDIHGRLTSWQNPDKPEEYLNKFYHTATGMIGLTDYEEQSGHRRKYFYDAANFYRVAKIGETFESQTNYTKFGYDELGRQTSAVYPTGLELIYRYNDAGHITKITNEQEGIVVWDKPEYNHRGQLTNSRKGNLLETTREYYPETGLLKSIYCKDIQSFEYIYNTAGNMTYRYNHLYTSGNSSLNEHFTYDNRNQLTAVYRNGAYPRYYQYDAMSNMSSKNDAGTFTYNEPSPYQPSEMSLVPNAPAALAQTHRAIYNSYNKIESLESDEYRLEITYGLGSHRIKQKLYSIGSNGSQLIKEKKYISGTTEIIIFEQKTDTITYITSPEGLTAIVVASSNAGGREWYWVFTDHLGSITTFVRNSDGQKYEMSYDAWGNRRNPATWETYTSNMPAFITDRGYTGHEHLDEFFLINMNGRMYDPQTTRFLSPDPVIADPGNPAAFNPYAYVLNNPLRYTDPSGYFVDPVSITAYIIAGAILYSSYAKQNADPKTGKWDWNFTNWFKKDRPGFTIGTITNTSFTSTTFFVSANFHNGTNSTFGYNTQYGWGTGNSPQNMYFPNHNSGTSEAAAVNNIASAGNYNFSSSQGSYMDALIYNTMTKTIVLAFNQYHVVSSDGPLGSTFYGSNGGVYFANSTAGFERNMGNPFDGGSGVTDGIPEWVSKTLGGVGILTKGRELGEWEYLRQAKFNRQLTGDFSKPVKHSLRLFKNAGRGLGYTSVALSGVDMAVNGINVSNSLDLIMGGVAFVPGFGWAVSGIYFVGNLGWQAFSGKTIGESIQSNFSDPKASWKPW